MHPRQLVVCEESVRLSVMDLTTWVVAEVTKAFRFFSVDETLDAIRYVGTAFESRRETRLLAA